MLAGSCRKAEPSAEPARADAGTASAAPSAPASPALVAQPKHDFGHVVQGETLRFAFATHNAGDGVLTVEDASEVLGCSGVPAPSVLEPGGHGRFEVTCRASIHGPLRVSLPLRANGRPAGELSLTGMVEPLVVFERVVLDVTLPFGDDRREEVRLRGKRARDARLTPASAPPPGLELSVLRGDAKESEGVAVRVSGTDVGTHVGSLRFLTGLSEPKELALSYVVKVLGTLEVTPTNPVLDLSALGEKPMVVTVKSSQPGFAVTRVDVMSGPFAAHVRRASGHFEIDVSAVPAKFDKGTRGVNGRLRIESNDRTEPSKEVPLFALGQLPATRAGH